MLPTDKKITVIFRLESGCLGPQGDQHIEAFCAQAQQHFASIDADFVNWIIMPRNDKQHPEREYRVNTKRLSREQAAQYLALFERPIEAYEQAMDDNLGQMINQYLGY